jgi:beta-glucosidase
VPAGGEPSAKETIMKTTTPQLTLAYALLLVSPLVVLNGCLGSASRWSETGSGEIKTVINRGGQTLGYVTTSGVSLLTVDRFAFKDLNKNGTLDPYEDWRLPADERAKDLASKMSIEQIAGLMLYSAHQAVPGTGDGFAAPTTESRLPRAERTLGTSPTSREIS